MMAIRIDVEEKESDAEQLGVGTHLLGWSVVESATRGLGLEPRWPWKAEHLPIGKN
jgi:hypothetical protein